ncbi:hypothetical protein ABZU25_02530 [Micromonospora sp. NPDC005215]|uniref:hypothetical protein n=1 Tax=Micromonospora sp. NPDC005215 TaxID=3157024 RepID=UPI0033BDB2E1
MVSGDTAAPRRVIATVAMALALGGCTTGDHRGQGGDPPSRPPIAPSPSPSTDPLADCPASGFRIRSTGGDAAMGLRALGLDPAPMT